MAVFHSRYRELSFYVDGESHTFSSGIYSTEDQKVIAVLVKLTDAEQIDTEEPEVADKSAPKPRKANVNTSAK